MLISSGGMATSTTVNSAGKLFVYNSGAAFDTVMGSGGSLTVSSGGKVTGALTIETGATVTVKAGGIVDFDISTLAPGNAALVNDLARVGGTPSYTITVSETQGAGTYTLAKGASSFNKTITVNTDAGATLGTITVGETLSSGDYDYTLVLDGAVLSLDVAFLAVKTFKNDILVSRASVMTAKSLWVDGLEDAMVVSSGGVADETYILDGAAMHVYAGGSASATVVSSGGYMYVSGGVAAATTVSSGGCIYVNDSGTVNGGTLYFSGRLFVLSAGVANGVLVANGGLYVSEGGFATGTILSSGGNITVYEGGSADAVELLSSSFVYVSNGGVANGMTVASHAGAIVSEGGSASGIAVVSGGTAVVYSGANATDVSVAAGALLGGFSWEADRHWDNIADGSALVAEDLYIVGKEMTVYSGVTATGQRVHAETFLRVSEGGEASFTTLYNDGRLIVSNGGVAVSTTVSSGGVLDVKNGFATATILSSGRIYASEGALVRGNTAHSGGLVIVSSAGLAEDTEILSGGSLRINAHGTASDITVRSGGSLTIMAKATGVMTFETGAYVYMGGGGVIDFDLTALAPGDAPRVNDISVVTGTANYEVTVTATQALGTYTLAGGAAAFNKSIKVYDDTATLVGTITVGGNISSGYLNYTLTVNADELAFTIREDIEDLDVTGSSFTPLSGATLSSTTVGSDGELYLSGAVASDTTVTSDGVVYVSAGGITSDTTIESGGAEHVLSGGVASLTVVSSGGELHVSSGGYAETTTVRSGGGVYVFTSGLASDTTIESDGVVYLSGGTAVTTIVSSGGEMHISEGGLASDTTDLGTVFVSSGGVADTTTVLSGGTMFVYSGGIVVSTFVASSGGLFVIGGSASVTTVDGWGSLTVSAGGTATSNTINANGAVFVSNGGTVESTFVCSNGNVHVYDGGSAVDNELQGEVHVSNGGVAVSTVISSGAKLNISNGGVAVSNTAYHEGYIYVYTGGSAVSTFLSGGNIWASSGGAAISTVVGESGYLLVNDSGTATSTVVGSSGTMAVFNATAGETVVESRGVMSVASGSVVSTVVENRGSFTIGDSGVAISTFIESRGTTTVSSGGVASETYVSSGGRFGIQESGIASDTLISSGGSVTVASGGKVTGSTTIISGAVVTFQAGGIVDFDISPLQPNNAALVNDLSLVGGTPSYTLTVSGTQELGTYTLAGGAAGFDQTVTVVTDLGVELGTVTIDSELYVNGVNYSLDVDPTGSLTVTLIDKIDLSISVDDAVFTYNGLDQYATEYTATGLAAGDYVDAITIESVHDAGTYSIAATAVTIRNAGGGDVTNKYNVTFIRRDDNVIVNAKDISVTALDQIKMVGNPDPTLTYTVDGLVAGDTLPGTLAREPGEGSGAYLISSGTLNSGGSNYNISSFTGAELRIYQSYGGLVLNDSTFVVAPFCYVDNTTVNSGGSLCIASEGIAVSTTVNSDGDLIVSSGGVASGAAINAGGGFFIAAGGTATGVDVESGGRLDLTVAAGTCITGTSNGTDFGIADGLISGYYLTDYNFLIVESGGTASATTVSNGCLIVSNGGSAAAASVGEGVVIVSTGGTVESAVLDWDGRLELAGGHAASTTVNSDGTLQVTAGAAAVSTVVVSGGSVAIAAGGTATSLDISAGGFCEFTVAPDTVIGGTSAGIAFDISGGIVSGFTAAADLVIASGARAEHTTLVSGARMQLESSALAAVTVVEYGFLNVMAGGSASATTVSGGALWVHTDGVADNFTVGSGGVCGIFEGGKVTGSMSFAAGAYVSAFAGGIVDFDISNVAVGGTALVNDLSLISGTPDYTITVSDYQDVGSYILAAGASGFDATITVGSVSGATIGTLTVDGEISAGSLTYSLAENDGALTLTVAPASYMSSRPARGDFNGNGTSDILFQNLVDQKNPLGAWTDADMSQWDGSFGPAARSDWTVYGSYDVNGDRTSDIIFRSKLASTDYAVGYLDMGGSGVFNIIGYGLGAQWDIAAIGDFTGSGSADFLWRNRDDGRMGLWLDGTDDWVDLPGVIAGNHKIFGAGDINGDDCDEILVNAGGVLGAWDISGIVNGTGDAPEWTEFGLPSVSSDWEVAGVGDFDGNGRSDILLWNDNGYLGAYMNCDPFDFRCVVANADKNEWSIPGIGDYNGDGCEDVLSRNSATSVIGYYSGRDNFSWNALGSGISNNWAVIA